MTETAGEHGVSTAIISRYMGTIYKVNNLTIRIGNDPFLERVFTWIAYDTQLIIRAVTK